MKNPIWQQYESALADPITRYLAAKRAAGCRFDCEDRVLRVFDRYLVEQGVRGMADVTPELLKRFLASRPRSSAKSYNTLLGDVRRLFDWLVEQHEISVSPLRVECRRASAKTLPYLFDNQTIRQMIDYAARLRSWPRAPDRGATYATMFSMLAALGLRIGEVSRLSCSDVDLQGDVLLIRNTKFGKSRYVPMGPKLAERVRRFAALREKRFGVPIPDAPFFTWNGRSRIATNSIRNAFRDHVMPQLALPEQPGTRHPCVHGLRHSFAVRTLLGWYREGVDPQSRLNHLSTFLGHVGPHSTAVYLTITSELLQQANQRFAAFAGFPAQEGHP